MMEENGKSRAVGADPQHEYSARILQRATDRWLASMALAECTRRGIAAEVCEYAQQLGMVPPPSILRDEDSDLAALQWLLPALDPMRQPIAQAALHRAIQIVSLEISFHAAVERSARRQLYNLAYGLTHEINNPLGIIVARAQRLIGETSDPNSQKSLATIMDQAMRGHEMLSEAMRAVQPPQFSLNATEIVPIVRQAWSSLADLAREGGIRWDCCVNSDRLVAEAHGPSLLEAFRMIGLNAIQACGPRDKATWSCDVIASGEKERVRITLSDTGPGLSPEAQRSATDLFYSGREHGRGLGCSLAIVLRIVEMHGGSLAIDSEEGAGCRVEIELPKIQTPRDPRPTIRL